VEKIGRQAGTGERFNRGLNVMARGKDILRQDLVDGLNTFAIDSGCWSPNT